MITRVNTNAPPVLVFFIIPLLVIYILFQILTVILPNLESTGRRVGDYVSSTTMGGVDDTGYLQIFPTLFGVFLLFIVLLAAGMFKLNQ